MTLLNKSLLWLIFLAVLFFGGIYYTEVPLSWSLFFILAISFSCELIDSSLGMGYGTLLTPTLLILGYSPYEIIPTLLISELFSGFSAAYFHDQIQNVDFHFKGVHLRSALLLMIGSLVGVVGGVGLSFSLDKEWLWIVIGTIIFSSGLFVVILSNKVIQYSNVKMLIVSIVAAFNKAMSGGGYGPLVTSGQILSGVEGKSAVGITALAEGFTCLLAALLFEFKGSEINNELFIPLLVGALSSIPFSVTLVSLSKEKYFKLICGLFTMTLGAITLLKGIHNAYFSI